MFKSLKELVKSTQHKITDTLSTGVGVITSYFAKDKAISDWTIQQRVKELAESIQGTYKADKKVSNSTFSNLLRVGQQIKTRAVEDMRRNYDVLKPTLSSGLKAWTDAAEKAIQSGGGTPTQNNDTKKQLVLFTSYRLVDETQRVGSSFMALYNTNVWTSSAYAALNERVTALKNETQRFASQNYPAQIDPVVSNQLERLCVDVLDRGNIPLHDTATLFQQNVGEMLYKRVQDGTLREGSYEDQTSPDIYYVRTHNEQVLEKMTQLFSEKGSLTPIEQSVLNTSSLLARFTHEEDHTLELFEKLEKLRDRIKNASSKMNMDSHRETPPLNSWENEELTSSLRYGWEGMAREAIQRNGGQLRQGLATEEQSASFVSEALDAKTTLLKDILSRDLATVTEWPSSVYKALNTRLDEFEEIAQEMRGKDYPVKLDTEVTDRLDTLCLDVFARGHIPDHPDALTFQQNIGGILYNRSDSYDVEPPNDSFYIQKYNDFVLTTATRQIQETGSLSGTLREMIGVSSYLSLSNTLAGTTQEQNMLREQFQKIQVLQDQINNPSTALSSHTGASFTM